MPDDILAGLNPAQREAVTTVKGPVLVLAGPGSGKTRVLAHRVAYLLRVAGVASARGHGRHLHQQGRGRDARAHQPAAGRGRAGELRLEGPHHRHLPLHLRAHPARRGRAGRAEPELRDLRRRRATVGDPRRAQRPQASTRRCTGPRRCGRPSRRRRTSWSSPQTFAPTTYYEEIAQRVYTRYEEILKANGALDFDDLLCRTTWLFKEQPEVLARYQDRYEYLLVDEFQDTNSAQYEMVCMLAARTRNLFCCGRRGPVDLWLPRRGLSQRAALPRGLPRGQGRACWSRTTAPRRRSSTRRTPSSRATSSARPSSCAPIAAPARR